MQTKLTLRLDARLIRQAKSHARRTGKSVSQMVADYFVALLDRNPLPGDPPLPPVTRSLYGALASAEVDENDHRAHLEQKHR